MKQKIINRLSFIILLIVLCVIPVKAETETAGTSVREENTVESRQVYSEDEREISGKWIKTNQEWTYRYSDGSTPKLSWRKIDGTWYYFNSKGYWIDDNTYERNTLKGIDVSSWQETIDWKVVKNDGVDFAIIRLGYNDKKLDKYYQRNMRNANAVGIPVGVYYYSKAVNEEEALRDAKFVIENMKGYMVSYPVAIDLEDAVQENLSKKELGKIVRTFADEILAAGYMPMVYTNENWYLNYIDWSSLGDIERWIANYNVRQNPNISRTIWQCCSTGRINGINGNVDINFGYKDYTKIITPRTEPLASYYQKSVWIKNDIGWWYSYANGGYPANQWEFIDNRWYYFDSMGYMQTDWQNIGGVWYYMNESGAMQTGWQNIEGDWYYMNKSGAMQTGWQNIEEDWYYMNESGRMQTGWQNIEGDWYYMNESGRMQIGWQNIGGVWYYMNESGRMQTGWQYIGKKWYYLQTNGVMLGEGWHIIDNNWYYMYSNGEMASDTWIDRYYVNSFGVWIG